MYFASMAVMTGTRRAEFRPPTDGSISDRLVALECLWLRAARGADQPPGRTELGFRELLPWIGDLAILDVETRPARVSLWGTNIVDRTGVDWTGKVLADPVLGALLDENGPAIDEAIARRRPVRVSGDLAWCARPWRRVDRLVLPMCDGPSGGAVTRVIIASIDAF